MLTYYLLEACSQETPVLRGAALMQDKTLPQKAHDGSTKAAVDREKGNAVIMVAAEYSDGLLTRM